MYSSPVHVLLWCKNVVLVVHILPPMPVFYLPLFSIPSILRYISEYAFSPVYNNILFWFYMWNGYGTFIAMYTKVSLAFAVLSSCFFQPVMLYGSPFLSIYLVNMLFTFPLLCIYRFTLQCLLLHTRRLNWSGIGSQKANFLHWDVPEMYYLIFCRMKGAIINLKFTPCEEKNGITYNKH